MKRIFTLIGLLIFVGTQVWAQTAGDYRSAVANGIWADASSWERFDGTNWVTAVNAPNNQDGAITILSGHSITINDSTYINELIVNVGGTVTQEGYVKYMIGNNGEFITVNGAWLWKSGTIDGYGTINIGSTGNFDILTAANHELRNDITNNGVINWVDGNIACSTSILNNQVFNVTVSNTERLDDFTAGGIQSFINNGTFNKNGTGTCIIGLDEFNNSGTVTCNEGIFRNESSFTNTGSIIFAGGTLLNTDNIKHNTGSLISGTGTFNNEGNQSINADQAFPVGVTLNQTAGTINFLAGKILTINGNWNWNSGTLSTNAQIVIGTSGILNLTTSGAKNFGDIGSPVNPFSITNQGVIDWQAGTLNWNVSYVVINNHNSIVISGNDHDASLQSVVLNNYGTISKSSSGTTVLSKLFLFNNAGTINCNAGIIEVHSPVVNTGLISFSGGTFFSQSSFDQNAGGQFNGNGQYIINDGDLNINADQDWPAGISFIQNDGDVNLQGHTLNIHGNYTINRGNLIGPGELIIATGATLNLETAGSKNIQSGATITNQGETNWLAGTLNWGAGIQTFNNTGLLNLGSAQVTNVNLNTASNPGSAILHNNGTIMKYTQTTSNLLGLTINNAGSRIIRGVGVINIENLNNDGILDVGHPIGSLSINGGQPFSSNSTLNIELGGAGQGSGYDYLYRSIGAGFVLNGTLHVTQTGILPNGSYRIISSSNLSGNFSSVQLPEYCTLQVSANAVDIIRNGPNAGDYRTRQDGDWSFLSTWERFNGLNWVTGSIPDESAGAINISHDITVNSLGIIGADQIVITGIGSLIINSRFFLRDGPGDDLVNTSGDGITIHEGGILSGSGTVNNQGRADLYGAGVIAVPFINNGVFYFTHATQGCCPGGLINFTDGLTTGRFDNYGSFLIYATPGISAMNILNGEFYNHTGAQFQANYTTKLDVSKFTNDGEFIVGVTGVSSAICTIKSDQGSTHSGGRFKSNGNSMQFVMQTNGTFTYAPDCVIDANIHYSTGIHEIYSSIYGSYDTKVSTTVHCGGAEVNFPGNVYVDGGDFGGPAVKKIGGSLNWWAGTVSGGNLVINDTASAQLGAGQTSLGTLATTFVNNGTVNLVTGYGGCCIGPVFSMTNGTIENNGQFIFSQTGGGGIYNETLSGGTFNNNSSGTIINNLMANAGQYGDNEIYLRNTIFTNNGTILANGKSLNIFPTTNPVIGGTITVAAGSQVKFGIPSTTTTIASNTVINGAGRVYFFDGNHQVNTPFYNIGSTYIGQIYSAANVNFNASNVALDYLFIYSGVLGGPATKLLKDDLVFISGQLTGGSIENTDTSVCYFGAGNPGLGAINTSFTNNGVVEVNPYYGGCCTEPVINMSGGSFTNNGTFNVTGSGGIRYVGLSNGTFINNAGGVINSNVGDVSFGEPSFRMQPSSFTNLGTINVLRNIMEFGAFTVGGVINVSPGALLRSTGVVTFNGSLINNNGNITVPFNFINASAKTLKGNGTFSSDVALNNAATVAPGSSPGILTVAGNYTQGAAALDIEIGGSTPGSGHDRLVVTGTAAISGTLNASEVNGFSPQSFTSIDILTASSVTGTFSQLNLPPFWSVQYAPNKVSLVKFLEFVYYRDQDGDGFGNVADTIRRFATTPPPGYSADSTDCNDANTAVNPAATEVCDGIDNNCDGIIDTVVTSGIVCGMATSEGQSFTLTAPPGKVFTSVDFASYGTPNGTCGNFTLGSCHASSTLEIVQGLVIGQNSVTLTQNYQIFGDPCVGIVKRFYVQARYSEVIPLAQTYYADTDGDGFGNPAVSQLACSQPSGYVLNNTDCNDNSAAVYPGATEVCDGLDNDCDGQIDLVINNTGLVAYYPFSGNANDARGSLNGTVNGATLTTDRFGNPNSAYSFDGINDFISTSNVALTQTDNWSMSAWVKPAASSSDVIVVQNGGDGGGVPCNGYSLGLNNLTVTGYHPCVAFLSSGATVPQANQWIFLTMVRQSGVTRFYFNGVQAPTTFTSEPITPAGVITIGSASGIRFFNGSIDDVKIYNVALTPTQILQDFNTVPLSQAYYADADGDGFGNPVVSQVACSQPSGYVLNNTDCNDNSAAVYPGATEVCDGLDNDCDGNIDAIVTLGVVCGTANENASVTLTAPAGRVFTAVNFASYGTPDGTCNNFSIGSCHASNSLSIVQGMVIGQNSVSIPASNGLFGDPCSGTPKRLYIQATYGEVVPLSQTFYADADGDGFGNPAVTIAGNCGSQAPTGYVSNNTDCNDSDANVYPGVQPGTVSGTATLCIGTTASYSSTGNAGGSWSSANEDIATVDPVTGLVTAISAGTTSIIYTINTCSGPQSASQTININATPVVTPVSNQMVNHGSSTTAINFSGTATSYTWVNDNPSIGLAASGSGNIGAFTAINPGVTAATATITVTPVNTSNGVSCTGTAISFTITVAPPAFSMNPVPNQVVCAQTLTSPVVFSSSTPGVTYNWTNSEPSISLAASGTGDIPAFLAQNPGMTDITATITVTPSISDGNGGSINGVPVNFTIRVNHRPQMTALNDLSVCRESSTDPIVFGGAATSFTWTNDNTGIGLEASGTGDIPSFIATNAFLSTPMIANVQVIPFTNDGIACQGTSESFTITVNPKPVMSNVANQTYCDGNTASVFFSGIAVTEYNWVSSNTLFGIDPFGSGNLGPAVVGFNTNVPVVTSFTVTPRYINNLFVCEGESKSFTITVNPTPGLEAVADQRLCEGQSTTDINFTSNVAGATFSWTNSVPAIGLPASGSGNIPSFVTTGNGNSNLVARAEANGCLGGIRNFSIIVDPAPVIDPISDVTVCNGSIIQNILIGSSSFTWTNSNPAIGLPASGTGAGLLPSFTAINNGITPVSATITVIGNSNNPGCFSAPVSFTITVNPTPSVDPVAHQFFCNENLTSVISFTGQQPGTVFNWTNNNTSIGLAASGTGDIPSFTPAITSINPVDANIIVVPSCTNNGVTCSTAGRDFTITIKPLPIVNDVPDKIVCNGATSNIQFTSFNGLANYFTWTNSNPSIGIPASGTGNIADFIAINNGTTPVIATITVTPYRNLINNIDCQGQSKTFTITVNPTPTVNNITEQTFCNGSTTSEIVLSGNVPGTNFVWINSNNSIGLASNGNGNIPSFIATNPNSTASIASILVTPQTGSGINTCTGPQVSFLINVRPTITPVVTASGPLTFCSNSNVTLTSDQPSGNLWSNGATTNSITVNASGTYTVTSTDMFGCSSSVSNPVTVTVNPYLAPAVTISAAATVICANTRPTFTASLSNLTAVAYNWKKNGVLAAITSTYAPALVQSGDIIICEVLGTNGCTNGSVNVVSNAIQLTIQPLANAGTINGLSTVAAGYNYPYTSNGNTGGVWASSNPSVLTIDPSTGISTTLIPGVTTITYTLLTGCGAPRTASKQVQVVAVTSPIVGSDYVCPQTTAISYSLAPTIPSGGTWSISNTSLATITVQSGTDRIISFTPVQTGSVTISYTLPGNIVIDKIVQIMNVPVLGPITGPRNLCEFRGTNNVFTYTKEPVNPITGYQWTVPSALTIVGGQGTSSLLVRLSPGYVPSDIYQLVATPVGFNCPVSAEAITLSSSVPQTPLPIIASANDICPVIGTNVPVTYTIPKVAGAASYIWQAQPGTTITHPNGLGKNDTTVQVTFSNAVATGTISVSAVNGCGASNTRGFTITRAIPATPGLISGPKAICAHIAPGGTVATYTVAQQPSVTSYNWSVPAGAIGLAGQGTNSISFTYPADYSGGTISVVAINGCGTSTTRSLSVSRLNPSMPSVIDVINITDCPNRQYIYSLNSMPANATSVQWTTPGLILSGQGTSSIRVLYPQGAIIGTVTATAISNCGSSSTRKLDVKIPACPPEFAGSAGNAGAKGLSVDLKPVQSFTAELFPNPAINDFFIRINSPDKYSSVQIRVLDAQGKEMSRMKIMPEETISAGHLLQPGIYFIEMIQGVNRQVHKLIKQ